MNRALIKNLLAWRPGGLARNTAFTGAWNLWRVALQAFSLVALARLFGSEGYGILAGTIAFFVTCAQFVGLGTGIALVRDGSRAPDAKSERYAETRTVYLLSGSALCLLAWALGTWLLGGWLSAATLAAFALAELVAAPAIMPLAYRFQSEERMNAFGAVTSIPPTVRLAATLVLLFTDSPSIPAFAVLYLALMVAAAAAVNFTTGELLPRISAVPRQLRYAREGLPYMLPSVSNTAGSELDKTIMLQHAGGPTTGAYAAAFRIAQAASLPVTSLLIAAAPRLFRSSAEDGRPRGMAALILAALGYAVPVAAAIWLLAPLAPWLLGSQFEASVGLLRSLSFVLVANCLRQVIVALLTTGDMQRERNALEGVAALGSVIAMLAVIPVFSASGAIVVLGATDSLVVLLGSLLILQRDRGTFALR